MRVPEICSYGKQGVNMFATDNSCGFWATAIALSIVLGVDPTQLPNDSRKIKELITSLYSEYWHSEIGGVSRHTILAFWGELDPNVKLRLGHHGEICVSTDPN